MGDLFSISQKYREQYPGVGFGLTLITDNIPVWGSVSP
jgi:hypothetical protein